MKKTSLKEKQLRKAEISDALADLRLHSHPGEFYDELLDWVLAHHRTPATIRSLLRQLQKNQPEDFATVVRSMEIPPASIGRPQKFPEEDNVLLFAAFRRSAVGMEKFARRCGVQDPDDSAADTMHKRLQRLSRRYKAEPDFCSRVDELVRLMAMLNPGT